MRKDILNMLELQDHIVVCSSNAYCYWRLSLQFFNSYITMVLWLCVYVYMCICVYVYMSIWVYVRVRLCACALVRVCACARVRYHYYYHFLGGSVVWIEIIFITTLATDVGTNHQQFIEKCSTTAKFCPILIFHFHFSYL